MIKRSVIVLDVRALQLVQPRGQEAHVAGLTSEHHPAKHCVVPLQRAAVPAMVPELVLALHDPLLGALPDGLHQVWVELAQLPLLVHQAGDVVADHPGTQRADVPASSGVVNVSRNLRTLMISQQPRLLELRRGLTDKRMNLLVRI